MGARNKRVSRESKQSSITLYNVFAVPWGFAVSWGCAVPWRCAVPWGCAVLWMVFCTVGGYHDACWGIS